MKIKRGLAIVLSSVMVLQMSVMAFATEWPDAKEVSLEVDSETHEAHESEDDGGDVNKVVGGGQCTYNAEEKNEFKFNNWQYSGGEPSVGYQGSRSITFTSPIESITATFIKYINSNPQPKEEEHKDTSDDQAPPQPEPEPQQEEPSEPPAPPVTIVSTSAGNVLPTAGLGNAVVNTKSISLNLYEMTPAQYVNFVVTTVATTPAGGEAIIDLNTASCLTAKMAQTITGRSDVTVTIIYIENGVRKMIRIPAGSDLSGLLDANGFIGFTALANAFGATELTE